jgi:hypothetical protein
MSEPAYELELVRPNNEENDYVGGSLATGRVPQAEQAER